MDTSDALLSIASALDAADISSCKIVTGFDGFVDEMISVVSERTSLDEYTTIPDITTFGQLITAAAGHSSLREIVVNFVHPGGCAVNLADGLVSLGASVACFATLGTPIHPAFTETIEKCRVVRSWGNEPGRTLAFEFSDGKTMFSSVRQLADFNAESVQEYLKDGSFAEACSVSNVIAITDWTLFPHMTDVWSLLQKKVFSLLTHRPHFFLDLVDPSSRTGQDILAMLEKLVKFENHGPVTLGLNGNEASILCRLLDLPSPTLENGPPDTLAQANALRLKLGISCIVIHCIPFAVCSTAAIGVIQPGPYCPKPKKSTGAGDRFNAGFCLALSLGWPSADCLALACATSGYFVRNARSGTKSEITTFLRDWANGFPD